MALKKWKKLSEKKWIIQLKREFWYILFFRSLEYESKNFKFDSDSESESEEKYPKITRMEVKSPKDFDNRPRGAESKNGFSKIEMDSSSEEQNSIEEIKPLSTSHLLPQLTQAKNRISIEISRKLSGNRPSSRENSEFRQF